MERRYLLCWMAQSNCAKDKKNGRKHSDVAGTDTLSAERMMIWGGGNPPRSSAVMHKLEQELCEDSNTLAKSKFAPLLSSRYLSRKNKNSFKLCPTKTPSAWDSKLNFDTPVWEYWSWSPPPEDELEELWKASPSLSPALVIFLGRRTLPWHFVLAQAIPSRRRASLGSPLQFQMRESVLKVEIDCNTDMK